MRVGAERWPCRMKFRSGAAHAGKRTWPRPFDRKSSALPWLPQCWPTVASWRDSCSQPRLRIRTLLSQTDQEHDYGHLQWPQCSLTEWWSIDTVEHRSSGLKTWLNINSKHCVYDILPPTTAIVDYAVGLGKLSANEQFFSDAQTAVRL